MPMQPVNISTKIRPLDLYHKQAFQTDVAYHCPVKRTHISQEGKSGCLMSIPPHPPRVKSQGCHLIPLFYLLYCPPCLALLFLSCPFSANDPFSHAHSTSKDATTRTSPSSQERTTNKISHLNFQQHSLPCPLFRFQKLLSKKARHSPPVSRSIDQRCVTD